MKKHLSILFGLSLMANVSVASDWTESYTPTRAEWLQHQLERNIRTSAGLWRIRTNVTVIIFPKDNAVVISIGAANGQPELTEAVCNEYRSTAESIAKMTLNDKSWSAGAKIQSKCIQ